MHKSKITNEHGTETDLAFNTRVAYGFFKAEHVGEETTDAQFIEDCGKKIENGQFILEKKPSQRSITRWKKIYPWEESAISQLIEIIQNRLETADEKYEFNILDLIVEDLQFIKQLYAERSKVFKLSFENPKDKYLTINHIENAISSIEKRVRVRLGLPTSYNNNKQEIEGNMNITQPGDENIHQLSDEDLDLILSVNESDEEFLDRL